MEITFRLCPDDLIAYEKEWKRDKKNAHAWRGNSVFYAIVIGVSIWGPFIFIVALHIMKTPSVRADYAANGLRALWVFLPFAVPILLFYFLWFGAVIFRKKMMESSPIVQTDVQLGMDKNGIAWGSDLIEWVRFQKLIVTETHLFLVDDRETTCIVPLRIFDSEFIAQEFIGKVRNYWDKAKENTNPPIMPD